jgi:uncharacterized protein
MTDIRRIDKLTAEKKNVSKELYADFLTNLNVHPETRTLVKNINENAVKRSIRNLILTNKGEAPFQPNKGSDINKVLFEQMSEITTEMLRTYIKETVDLETRCNLLDIVIIADEANNSYAVSIFFELINNNRPLTLVLNLQRIR